MSDNIIVMIQAVYAKNRIVALNSDNCKVKEWQRTIDMMEESDSGTTVCYCVYSLHFQVYPDHIES